MIAQLSGSREARPTSLRRLLAKAAARELDAFVVPGLEVARARGLDLAAAGLRPSGTPRHASVLVLVGGLPVGLKKAVAVAYAQMPRPRAILAVGAGDVSPLPEADVSVSLGQEELASGVAALRSAFAEGAFSAQAEDFDVDEIRTQTQYVCPMHPEVVSDEPGSCPKCGMDLVPREAAGGGDHGHMGHEHAGHEDMDHGHAADASGGSEKEAGDHGAAADRRDTGGEAGTEYACPMHPEVVRDEPGSCPICGMDLVPRDDAEAGHGGHAVAEHEDPGPEYGSHGEHEAMDHGEAGDDDHHEDHGAMGSEEHEGTDHAEHGGHAAMGDGGHEGMEHGDHEGAGEDSGGLEGHGGMDHGEMNHGEMDHGEMDHGDMDHGDMGFMSMVAMTEGTPRSSDGLQMEWVEAPFGPLFPGLPGGLSLALTLDGDTVAEAKMDPAGVEGWEPQKGLTGPAAGALAEKLALLDPLSPVSYRLLALRALEDAAGAHPDEGVALARVGALERERAVSHLNWLALFARLLGYPWLEGRAGKLVLALSQVDDAEGLARLADEAGKLARVVDRTPLLGRRLRGIGGLEDDSVKASGPVARAAGVAWDTRDEEEVYRSLGFAPVVRDGDDAFSRFGVRLAETVQSLELVKKAGAVLLPEGMVDGTASGTGAATVESPRGPARLEVTLEEGAVVAANLDTPSSRHLELVGAVAEGRELADALVGVASLDLSPWEVTR